MSENRVSDGVVVGLAYELRVDGEKVDEATVDEPFEYLHGAMNIVPGLEAALAGRRVGDRFQVTVPPDQGYGHYDPDEVEWFDKDEFDDPEEIELGAPLAIEYDDEILDGLVTEVTEDQFAVDFNPPLAGKTLEFDVEVVSLRAADPDELEHGHPHTADWDDDEWEEWDEEDWDADEAEEGPDAHRRN